MASEDQDILAKIGQLAGQINRHKSGQSAGYNPIQQTYYRPPGGTNTRGGTESFVQIKRDANRAEAFPQANRGWGPSRGAIRSAYSSRGYSRGGRQLQVHRNRTLVLNGNSPTTSSPNDAASDLENFKQNSSNLGGTGQGWVTKTDRHLQLINTSIFEKDSQNRVKAMEETRKLKLRQRDEREKAKFNKHLQRLGGNVVEASRSSSRSTDTTANYEINVQGIRFRVTKNGGKLVKAPDDLTPANSTPKTATIGGVRFYRSKNGNLYRSGVLRYQRRDATVKKINELCKIFTNTGSCSKGPGCRYIHDPSKVAVCKEWLQKGSCPSGDSCDLSHDLTPERTPACLHFTKGKCSNPNCRYTHVRVSPTALVCRSFGIYGYCEKGSSCQERHVHECPDYSNTGICKTKGCKLPHRHKASVIRKDPTRGDLTGEDNCSDISSDDEEEEIDSDDVDSDDLDEKYFGGDGEMDLDIMQQDFVQLS